MLNSSLSHVLNLEPANLPKCLCGATIDLKYEQQIPSHTYRTPAVVVNDENNAFIGEHNGL